MCSPRKRGWRAKSDPRPKLGGGHFVGVRWLGSVYDSDWYSLGFPQVDDAGVVIDCPLNPVPMTHGAQDLPFDLDVRALVAVAAHVHLHAWHVVQCQPH